MLENIKGIQNPLTVIALFAGLAEVAGTAAMAAVSKDLQGTFIWFVMGFPTLLVLLFFATLNFNSRVLYAPSDVRSDETFLKLQGVHISGQAKEAVRSRSAYEKMRAAVVSGDGVRISKAVGAIRKILAAAGYQIDEAASAVDLLGSFQKALLDTDPDLDPSGEKLKILNAAVAAVDLD